MPASQEKQPQTKAVDAFEKWRAKLPKWQRINLDWAIKYAEAGFWITALAGKGPVLPRWNTPDVEITAEMRNSVVEKFRATHWGRTPLHVGCTRDPNEIKRMWRKDPTLVPGIVCGPSGLFVIDCDVKRLWQFVLDDQGVVVKNTAAKINSDVWEYRRSFTLTERHESYQYRYAAILKDRTREKGQGGAKRKGDKITWKDAHGHHEIDIAQATLVAEPGTVWFETVMEKDPELMKGAAVTRTPSGGVHVIYRNPTDVERAIKATTNLGIEGSKVKYNIDFLAGSRQFLPPWACRGEQLQYKPDDIYGCELIELHKNGVLREVPDQIREIVKRSAGQDYTERRPVALNYRPGDPNIVERCMNYVRGAVKKEGEPILVQRHETLGNWIRRFGDFGLNAEEAVGLMLQINLDEDIVAAPCDEADFPDFLLRQMRSRKNLVGSEYDPNYNARSDGSEFGPVKEEDEDQPAPELVPDDALMCDYILALNEAELTSAAVALARDLNSKTSSGGVSARVRRQCIIDTMLKKGVEKAHADAALDQIAPMNRLSSSMWDNIEAIGPREYIIEGLILKQPEGSVVAIYGPPKTFKTQVTMDMCGAVFTGLSWNNRTTKKTGVLYAALEGRTGFTERAGAMYRELMKRTDSNPSQWPFRRYDVGIDLLDNPSTADRDNKSVREIIQEAKLFPFDYGVKCGIIVLDTLTKATGKAAEDTHDTRVVLARARHIAAQTGACVIVITHTPKSDQASMRGSTVTAGDVDLAILLARGRKIRRNGKASFASAKDGFITVKVALARDVRDDQEFTMKRELVTYTAKSGVEVSTQIVTSVTEGDGFGAVDEQDERTTPAEGHNESPEDKKLTTNARLVLEVFREMAHDMARKSGGDLTAQIVANTADFAQAVQARKAELAGGRARVSARTITRALGALVDAGKLVRVDDGTASDESGGKTATRYSLSPVPVDVDEEPL